jgi:hypothetical protein
MKYEVMIDLEDVIILLFKDGRSHYMPFNAVYTEILDFYLLSTALLNEL